MSHEIDVVIAAKANGKSYFEILQTGFDWRVMDVDSHLLEQWKNNYRSLSVKTHPDKTPPEFRDKATLAQTYVNEAWDILSDDKKRSEYIAELEDMNIDPNDASKEGEEKNGLVASGVSTGNIDPNDASKEGEEKIGLVASGGEEKNGLVASGVSTGNIDLHDASKEGVEKFGLVASGVSKQNIDPNDASKEGVEKIGLVASGVSKQNIYPKYSVEQAATLIRSVTDRSIRYASKVPEVLPFTSSWCFEDYPTEHKLAAARKTWLEEHLKKNAVDGYVDFYPKKNAVEKRKADDEAGKVGIKKQKVQNYENDTELFEYMKAQTARANQQIETSNKQIETFVRKQIEILTEMMKEMQRNK